MGKTQAKQDQKSKAQDREGYQKALDLLRECSTSHGFLASLTDKANYHRVWGRDGSLMSLAALTTDDSELIETARTTLKTLREYQGPHGEIPSNVDPETDRISYGGTAGRVDADLWFVIAVGEYWKLTGDKDFLKEFLKPLEKVRFLLGCWEFNSRGLLYIPQTGDWADEYIHNGYVLYDQLLYLQAQCVLAEIHKFQHDSVDHLLQEKITRLKHLVRANYWFWDHCDDKQDEDVPEDVYHPVLYRKSRNSSKCKAGRFWMPFFSPQGYGYRFDALANILVSFLNVADDDQRQRTDDYIQQELVPKDIALIPAFHPVIEPEDGDWHQIQMTFSYSFKNKPYQYHNGGLWPMLTGFYVADLAARGHEKKARQFLEGIDRANAMELDGEPWSFPEYVHGKEFTPGGTRGQGWSAAGAVIAHQAIDGNPVFRIR